MIQFVFNRLFPEILNMSLTGSIVILAVLFIRIFLRKAPKKWSYLLWLAVAFRLACPVSVSSPVSLLGAVNAPVTAQGTIEYIDRAAAQPQITIPLPAVPAPGLLTPDLVVRVPQTPEDPTRVSAMELFAVVWLAGMAVAFVYSVVSYLQLRRRLANAIVYKENVWQSDRVQSPFILGFVRPRIYIPFGLDQQTQDYVLAHERYHLKRKDHMIKPLAFALLALHWFNPLCWLAFQLMGRDMEMSCDEQVLARADGDRRVYSTALLSFAANRRFPVPSPLAFGEGEVRPRITNVLNWKKPKIWVTVAAGVLCGAVLLLCALNPGSPNVEQGYCTVIRGGETAEYRMERHSHEEYGPGEYDADTLPRVLVNENDTILFYGGNRGSDILEVTEYFHFVRDGSAYAKAVRTYILNRGENGEFALRIYPQGNIGDFIVYEIRREDGRHRFRVDIVDPNMTGAYGDVKDFIDQTMATEKTAGYFVPDGGRTADGGAAMASARVTGARINHLKKCGELAGLAPNGVLEAWESGYLLALDADPDEVGLAGGQYEQDGWYNLNGYFNVIALRYEDGSCDILGYEHQGGDNMDFKGIRSYEEALHDWYVKKYDLTEVSPLYVEDWIDKHSGSTFACRYDGAGWSIYIPINTWTQRDVESWYSAYDTGAELRVSASADTVDEQIKQAEAEGRTVTDEGNCHRIDYEYSSTFLYPRADGQGSWNVFVKWPAALSPDIYDPSPEQEREELFKMARSFVLPLGRG